MKTTLKVLLWLNLIGVGYNFGHMLNQCFEHMWLMVGLCAFAMVLGIVSAIACDNALEGMEVRK